jgi:hypothetical protein
MEEKITLSNNKEYIVKEVKYKDLVGQGKMDEAFAAKKLLQLSTSITDEDYENLSMKDGIMLTQVVNRVNGLSTMDFQVPQTK